MELVPTSQIPKIRDCTPDITSGSPPRPRMLRREAERSKDRVRELEGELADSKQREEDSSKLAEEWKAYADSLENQDEEGEEEGEEESGEESEEEPPKGQR